MRKELKFNQAILVGVADSKELFGTILDLQEKFGSDRVIDIPNSENPLTGVPIESGIRGMCPILTFQRVDFFILALDQLINNDPKWYRIFGDQMTAALVIRLVMGCGWRQRPQQSQSLQSLFRHIPGGGHWCCTRCILGWNPADGSRVQDEAVSADGSRV